MMSRAEVRRSLLAIGVEPGVVEGIVAALPAEVSMRNSRAARPPAARADDADRAAAQVIADFERLFGGGDAS